MRDDHTAEPLSHNLSCPNSDAKPVSQKELDSYLAQTLNFLARRWFEPGTGVVAACLLDPETGHAFYDVSRDVGHNLYSHAERNVIALYEDQYGRPPPKDAILITTLSPCVGDTSWRVGESCSDLVAKYGLRRLHVGLIDPQHPPHAAQAPAHEFEITVTGSEELAKMCQGLRDLFNLKAPRRMDGSPGRLAEAYKNDAVFKSVFKPRTP